VSNNVDLLIVGAGPTGLMLASEAASYGLSCRIIDRTQSPYKDTSRAVGIQSRTLEIFDKMGIVDSFLREGLKVVAANQISNFKRLSRIPLSAIDSSYPFVLSVEQAKTEEILTDHAASLGVQVERSVECKQITQNEKSVQAALYHLDSKEEETITASWLVGCDGAHSIIRKLIGLSFKGRSFSDIFSLADVHVHWEYPHNEVAAFLNPKGVLAAIPLPEKDRYRLVFQLLRCRNLLKNNRSLTYGQVGSDVIAEPTLEEVESLLKEYAGSHVSVTDPRWMANFHINSRMATTYRKDRVFLAGDAAHIHSPIGAQGMNTGLQDAYNLAWKLSLVQNGTAHAALLDTYNTERHAVGRTILRNTERASFMATLRNPLAVGIRNHILSFFVKIAFFRKRVAQGISQTMIRYPKSILCEERNPFSKGPKAGVRAPNAPVMVHGGVMKDLYTIWRKAKNFQILFFTGPENGDLSHIAERFRSPFVMPIIISYSQNEGDGGILNCPDSEGKAHKIYGAKSGCVYVIRPDGYIGYRSHKIDEADIKKYFQGILRTI